MVSQHNALDSLTFQLHVHIQSVVNVLTLHIQTLTMTGPIMMNNACCLKICMRMFAIFTALERLVFQNPKAWRWYWTQGPTAQSSPWSMPMLDVLTKVLMVHHTYTLVN